MKRIQRKRTKGWRMPPGTRYVGRLSRWGNPFKVIGIRAVWHVYLGSDPVTTVRSSKRDAEESAVDLFREYARERLDKEPGWLDPLVGHDLACWCGLDHPCHADVLIEMIADK